MNQESEKMGNIAYYDKQIGAWVEATKGQMFEYILEKNPMLTEKEAWDEVNRLNNE